MGRIVERSQELLHGRRRLGPLRLLHERPALPRGVLHARGDRQGRASARRTWTATRGSARRRRRRRSRRASARDGQPGSYTDVDHCDAIALWGHNVAETQTVLWMRMLDRRRGADPPRMLAVDPRPTPVAREADVHLAIRNGTNLALMNALLREMHRARAGIDDGVRRRAHRRLRPARARGREPTRRSARPRSAASRSAGSSEAAELLGTSRAPALDGAAGLLPVATRRRPRRARSTTSTCCAA